MRRVIRKRIRRQGDGFDLAADLNVDISMNVERQSSPARPDDGVSETRPEAPAPTGERPRTPREPPPDEGSTT